MRPNAPTPTGSPLPLPRPRAAHHRRTGAELGLTPAAIAEFNRYLHELHPDAPHIDEDAIASVARWLKSQPEPQRDLLMQVRLDRLADLRAMRDDEDWAIEPNQARRIDRLLAYVEGNSDLFPDDMPVIGRLDDALLVELVWPMLADDLEDYADFCRFRSDARGQGAQRIGQKDWLRARMEEGALWEQLHRVHEHHYADHAPPSRGFHVGG